MFVQHKPCGPEASTDTPEHVTELKRMQNLSYGKSNLMFTIGNAAIIR
jgi:hypothetical protein